MTTTNPQEAKAVRTLMTLVISFFVMTWVFLFISNLNLRKEVNEFRSFGPIDVARRVTSPDGSRTAVLTRSYATLMDLNFILFVTDNALVNLSDPDAAQFLQPDGQWKRVKTVDGRGALWISHDYEKTTGRNWNEDVIWSQDSTIVAVQVEGEFVFAYNFSSNKSYEDMQQIDDLLSMDATD